MSAGVAAIAGTLTRDFKHTALDFAIVDEEVEKVEEDDEGNVTKVPPPPPARVRCGAVRCVPLRLCRCTEHTGALLSIKFSCRGRSMQGGSVQSHISAQSTGLSICGVVALAGPIWRLLVLTHTSLVSQYTAVRGAQGRGLEFL